VILRRGLSETLRRHCRVYGIAPRVQLSAHATLFEDACVAERSSSFEDLRSLESP
jgi:hypothetical protein